MENLKLVPLKNNLLVDSNYVKIKAKIIARLTELSLVDTKYKLCSEFLALVSNLVENLITKKHKIDKKEFVIDIIHTLFVLTDDEKIIVSHNIDFLCSQSGIIKKVSWYKLFKCGLGELFRKKA